MAEDDPDDYARSETQPSPSSSPPPPPPEPRYHRAGDVVGRRWRLERFLDGGGMGTVWQATDLRLDTPAAVKLLNPHLVRTEEARARFLREARAAARLRGPHVVAVLDFDIDPDSGAPYMAMELLRGETLDARLRRGRLGWLQTRTILRDLAQAIARAHAHGIVHRDLKPANVFLATEDEGTTTKVLDFGIAKLAEQVPAVPPGEALTDTGRTLGTPNYMAPEQVSDASRVDPRADLWALATIVYECLVGERAFPGDLPLPVIHRICTGRPDPASERVEVPEGFDAWFDRATDKDPDRRFDSAEELLEAFDALIPSIDEAGSRSPRPASRGHHLRAWVSDANQVDIETVEQVVFENAVVREFLDDERRFFVSGAKGCGKTLLLTTKRARLDAKYRVEKGSAKVTFVPEGRPYLDLMSDLRTVGRPAIEFMAQLVHAKRLWGFALRLSVVSHFPAVELPAAVLAALPPPLRVVASGRPTEPTLVAKEVLALSVSKIHKLLERAETALEHAVRSVHSGVFVFVDKLDQALRGVGRDAWISMQSGLVEAAWELMNTNAHVKVFATIREEAFSAYESDIKTNLFGATTRLRYSPEDLRQMLERLTELYEGLPLRDFVSLDVVHTGHAPTEPAFDYLHRHTLGRPRDFVIVASEISRRHTELDERVFKEIVQDTCSGILVANVFDEMRAFLEVLADRQRRMDFLSKIPFGALLREDLVEVWCALNGLDRNYLETYARNAEEVFHPFRELYDCGLLGLVVGGIGGEGMRQRFKQPHDPMDAFRYDVPASEVYLLHPSLTALMRRFGLPAGENGPRDLVIGHERPWLPHHGPSVRTQRELLRGIAAAGYDPGLGATVRELLADLGRQIEAGQPFEEARRAIAATPRMAQLTERLEALGWDDLHLALLDTFPSGP